MRPSRWVCLMLLAGIACCSQGSGSRPPDDLKATTSTNKVRVFLIRRGGGEGTGDAGRKVGCHDDAVPVTVTLPQRTPALEGALEGLFSLGRDPYDEHTGLYNSLHASPLAIEKIERRGAEATVRLKGYLEVGDACDGQRALAQLTETVLQFPDVRHVRFYLEGQPLQEILPGLSETSGKPGG